MDANNTNYHSLLGERDWLPLLLNQGSVDCWWDRDRQWVMLAPVVRELDELARGELLDPSRRRGASFDHYGNIFWINALQSEIHYRPGATPDRAAVYWRVNQLIEQVSTGRTHGDFGNAAADSSAVALPALRGLTVTAREYLVVGTLDPGGLLIFDLHGGGSPSWLQWPASTGFHPYDMCSTPDGGCWILAIDPASGRSVVWYLDQDFRLSGWSGEHVEWRASFSQDFTDLDADVGEPACPGTHQHFFSGIALNDASSLIATNPLAIEAVGNNAFILLDTPVDATRSSVHYFVNGRHIDSVELDQTVTGDILNQAAIAGHDIAFVPGAGNTRQGVVSGDLYVAASHAKQSFSISLRARQDSLRLELQPRLIPMRSYSGKALAASGTGAWYDYGDRWLPLAEQPLQTYQSGGQLDGLVLDSELPDCVWHRVILDACIPPGTSVRLQSRAANSERDLAYATWTDEPEFHRRTEGSELPFHQPFEDDSRHGGSWDLLLQQATGRFIEIRLLLGGNRRSSPLLRACRIYFPRFSYLERYLPAVYRDDTESAGFLDRFLANLEGLYTGLEDKIARAESLFDSRTSPEEFLEWLAQWLGALVDPAWDEARKRLFIQNAFLLFKWRGTSIGLRALLHLHIDDCPDDRVLESLRQARDVYRDRDGSPGRYLGSEIRIVEQFSTRRFPVALSGPEVAGMDARLPLSAVDDLWSPQQGPEPIHRNFQGFLSRTYEQDIAAVNAQWGESFSEFAEILFPPLLPVAETPARDWLRFTRDIIGFTYAAVSEANLAEYRDFLQRRYRHSAELNRAHGLLGAAEVEAFDDVQLPGKLPLNTRALADWIEFVAVALPIAEQAHTFTVLLPTQLGDLPSDLELRRAQVEEIVEREKPSHTQFEVKFFWALFQVGSARLGIDTHIGDGSRFAGLVLGRNFLGQSFLSESHPWSVVDRSVLGRERLTSPHAWRL